MPSHQPETKFKLYNMLLVPNTKILSLIWCLILMMMIVSVSLSSATQLDSLPFNEDGTVNIHDIYEQFGRDRHLYEADLPVTNTSSSLFDIEQFRTRREEKTNRRFVQATEDDSTLISEQFWVETYRSGISLVNYTFYLSSSGFTSVRPNCTIDYPCANIGDLMKAIDSRLFTPANSYFLYSLLSKRIVMINVILLDDLQVQCDSNRFIRSPLLNLMFMFRFTSFGGERRTLSCNTIGLLFESTRYDVLFVLFAHINLNELYIRNDYFLNFAIHHSSVYAFAVINFDTANSKKVAVEYCDFENTAITFRKSDATVLKYTKFKYSNTLSLYNAATVYMEGLDVRRTLKTDFLNIQQVILYQCRFIQHSIVFFMTNIGVVQIEECHFENQIDRGVMFDITRAQAFNFFNSFAKGNILVLDVKGQNIVRIINSTFIENRVPSAAPSIATDSYLAYNSPVNIRSCLSLEVENSTFDNNFGLKGAHIFVQDVIDIFIESCRFLNGNGSAVAIDTIPSTDLYRYSIQVHQSLFENNYSTDYGGALRILYSIQTHILNCIFNNNRAAYSGGAISIVLANLVSLNGTVFYRNSVDFRGESPDQDIVYRGSGGAITIHHSATPLNFGGVQFIENEAYVGGALFYSNKAVNLISDSLFRKNKATNTGGAIFQFFPNFNSNLKLENVDFQQNTALVYGNDYFSSVDNLVIQNATYVVHPGQKVFVDMKAFTYNNSVPCFVDRYIVISPQYPNIYFQVDELKDGLDVTLLIENGTLEEYVGKTLTTVLRVEHITEISLVFPLFSITSCPERTEFKFTNTFNIAAFACVPTNTLTWKEIVGIAVPLGIVFFILGSCSGAFMVYALFNIIKRLKLLSNKQKAEKAVAKRIIDKRIIFGSDNESSKSIISRADNLSSPLLASDMIEMKISRNIDDFIIPIEAIEIVSKLAEGGQGVVYLATLYGKTKVAVKSLKKNFSDQDEANSMDEEFEREVSILFSLKHPNILKFYGISVTEDSKYMVTEFLENGSLEKLIYNLRVGKATLNFKQKLLILLEICSGLEYLHSLDPPIVHRDLKPGNILFDSDYRCKLCDFGLSRSVGNLNSNNTMTKNVGTLFYSSLESWVSSSETSTSKEKILKATKIDIYSLGILMHELFFEVNPYSQATKLGNTAKDENVINILSHIMKGKRPHIPFNDIDQVREWLQLYPLQPFVLNSSLCQIVLDYFKLTIECWSDKPEQRPPIKQVTDELKRLVFELSVNCE